MKKLIALLMALLMLAGTAVADEIVFTELVVVDNEECTIKITAIDPDDWMGFALKVYLENKSADKTYMYSVERASVNGLESDPFWASEVLAGKKANSTINFMEESLAEKGVTKFTDIELTFRVYDTNDWMADPVAQTTVHVYPYGEENVESFVREEQNTDLTLMDNENATVVVTGCGMDDLWGYAVSLYLVNKTDSTIMFSVEDASVNGFMIDPFWAMEVAGGKQATGDISWFDTQFEENGISEVEEIEFTLIVYDEETFDTLCQETITIHP